MACYNTRSRTTNELRTKLRGFGLYEDGMTVEEMREIVNALEMSKMEGSSYFENDVARALRESEMDFLQVHGELHNSTMISSQEPIAGCGFNDTSNRSSESQSERITTQAQVHHSMDWSPPRSPCRPAFHREPIQIVDGGGYNTEGSRFRKGLPLFLQNDSAVELSETSGSVSNLTSSIASSEAAETDDSTGTRSESTESRDALSEDLSSGYRDYDMESEVSL